MALQKEIWISDIESNLFANNNFMNIVGKDDSAYVDNLTVHLPQAGSKPNVAINRSSLPASIGQRTDTDKSYSLSEYTTDPILIQNTEAVQLSYNKRMDVLGDHIKQLGFAAANKTLYSWAASGTSRIVRTSGGNSSTALAPSATSTRKALTLEDWAAAKAVIAKDDVNTEDGVYAIVPSDMYYTQLLLVDKISKYLEFGKAVLPEGVVDRLFGVNIIVRSSAVVYDNTGTPVIKSTGTNGLPTGAASDNLGIIMCSKYAVRKALGAIKVFDTVDSPEYYGDIFSALVLHGATQARTNQEGIVSIVQAA